MRGADADDLLRRLGRGVRPVGGATRGRELSDSPDFQSLLGAARSGAFRSGRRVRVPYELGVELNEDQKDDLDRAGDAAEVAGVSVFAAVVDGLALLVNVRERTAIDARALRDDRDGGVVLVRDAEAFVALAPTPKGDDEDDDAPRRLAPALRAGPPARIASASLLRTLGDVSDASINSGE